VLHVSTVFSSSIPSPRECDAPLNADRACVDPLLPPQPTPAHRAPFIPAAFVLACPAHTRPSDDSPSHVLARGFAHVECVALDAGQRFVMRVVLARLRHRRSSCLAHSSSRPPGVLDYIVSVARISSQPLTIALAHGFPIVCELRHEPDYIDDHSRNLGRVLRTLRIGKERSTRALERPRTRGECLTTSDLLLSCLHSPDDLAAAVEGKRAWSAPTRSSSPVAPATHVRIGRGRTSRRIGPCVDRFRHVLIVPGQCARSPCLSRDHVRMCGARDHLSIQDRARDAVHVCCYSDVSRSSRVCRRSSVDRRAGYFQSTPRLTTQTTVMTRTMQINRQRKRSHARVTAESDRHTLTMNRQGR
jgi:hypothetical protein